MNEKPILFSAPMVQAILDGRKTMTRRVIKLRDGSLPDEYDIPTDEDRKPVGGYVMDFSKTYPRWQKLHCPYGKPGDRLWVRETWNAQTQSGKWWHEIKREDRALLNWAWTNPVQPAFQELPSRWLPSIHMPKAASRIQLEIVRVGIEQLQDISAIDIAKEGCPAEYHMDNNSGMTDAMHGWFENLWKNINGEESWDWNPWLWVVEFKVL